MGAEESNSALIEEEKKAVYDIIRVESEEGKASVYLLEELCDFIETEIFTEDDELVFERKEEQEYNLEDVP